MRQRRTRSLLLALGSLAALAASPAVVAAQSLPMAIPSGPTWVAGYELGVTSQGVATFAGSAMGALHGAWTASVDLPAMSPVGPLPSALAISGGSLSIAALGQTFTVGVAPTTVTLQGGVGASPSTPATPASCSATTSSPSPSTSTTSSSASSSATTTSTATSSSTTSSGTTPSSTSSASAASSTSTAPAAAGTTGCPTPPAAGSPSAVVPETLGAAEEMLQVYSGAYYAAKGDPQAQQGLAAQAAQIESALPVLRALGAFPLPSGSLIWPPRVLAAPGANGCGDVAYSGTLTLSLAGIAGGTFEGQIILYRTMTQAGCATYASALSGTLAVGAPGSPMSGA